MAFNAVIPGQTYPVGTTNSDHQFTQNPNVSDLNVSVDCSSWTSASTTAINFVLWLSFDQGVTWTAAGGIGETQVPPWNTKGGTTSNATMRGGGWEGGNNPTTIRVAVTVFGAAVTLGQIQLGAT